MIQQETSQKQLKKLDYESDLMTDEINQRLKEVFEQSQNQQIYQYQEIVSDLQQDDQLKQYNGLLCLFNFLQRNNDPAQPQIVDNQLIACLFKIINNRQTPYQQYIALKCLLFIAQELKQISDQKMLQSIIQLLISVLNNNIYDIIMFSLQKLGVFGRKEYCYITLRSGGSDAILQLLIRQQEDIDVQKQGTETLAILCQENKSKQFKLDRMLLPFLCQKFETYKVDNDILREILLAIVQLTEDSQEALHILTKSQIVCQIANYINDKNKSLAFPALRIIGNLSTGDYVNAQAVISSGVFKYIPQLLQNSNQKMVREICWMLSNIAADSKPQANYLLNQIEIMQIISKIGINCNTKVKKEIIFILCNLANTIQDSSIHQLLNYNFFKICQVDQLKDKYIPKLIRDAVNNIKQNVKDDLLQNWQNEIENILKLTQNTEDVDDLYEDHSQVDHPINNDDQEDDQID